MTYAELQAMLKTWLRREDMELDAEIPGYIGFAEDRLSRDLRIPPLLAFDSVTIPAASGSGPLPPRYSAMRSVKLASGKSLGFITSDKLDFTRRQSNSLTTPAFYTTAGGDLHVAPIWSAGGTCLLMFYRREPPLATADNNTNWYLENVADLLLAASMLVAVVALKADTEMVGRWRDLYTQNLETVNAQFRRE